MIDEQGKVYFIYRERVPMLSPRVGAWGGLVAGRLATNALP